MLDAGFPPLVCPVILVSQRVHVGSPLARWAEGRGRDSFLGQFWQDRFVGRGFSFRADETEKDGPVPALLVDVICRSVGVAPAVVHAVGVGALCRGPAEAEAAASLTVAVRDCLNDEDQTLPPVHEPVRAGPEDMWVGSLDECCSLVWGKTLVETCGPEACSGGLVLRGDPNGTTKGADPTGRSVRDWEQCVVEGLGFLWACSTAVADALDPNGEGRIGARKCLAEGLGDPLLVWGTEEPLAVPALEREDLRPVRSCERRLVT